jgi:hypothetical protein
VIFTHLPWYHFSQLSQQIQNSSLPSFNPQVPHSVLSRSSSSSPSSSPLSSSSLGGATLAFERDSDLDCCEHRCCYKQKLRLDSNRTRQYTLTTLEIGLLLLLLLLGVFSLVCFLADPVTTSNIVGKLFIMPKSLLLHNNKYNEFAR